ncbi:MAG: PAS domain S-box protein [Anaerolineae bacterium]|nr:PAS domain S-box protein [Anaerolineae bacterium]NUQ02935.1 PAS domain S-box protein [Anaerolineae bacterium]
MSLLSDPISTRERILFIGDSPLDEAQLMFLLYAGEEGADPGIHRVTSFSALQTALAEHSWDLVLCDSVVTFTSPYDILKTAQALESAAPVIIIMPALNGEAAALIRAGARAAVEASDLPRLAQLIERELETSRLRRTVQAMKAALRASEAGYESIVEHQTELICRYNTDFILTFVNRAYCEWRGQTREDLLGANLLQQIPVEDRDRALAHVRALTHDNPVSVSVHRSIMTNLSRRWIEWTDRALFDADGSFIEYQGVGRDITESRAAQERLHFLYRLLNETYVSVELDDVLRTTLRLICAEFAFIYSEVWLLDREAHLLRCAPAHCIHPDHTTLLSPFYAITQATVFRLGEGIPGRTWESQAAIWIPDVEEGSSAFMPRLDAARQAGLHGSVSIPVVEAGEVLAVLVFMKFEVMPHDESTLDFLKVALGQIAPIIRRQHFNNALRASEERYRSLLESSDAAISMVDYGGRYLYLNGISAHPFGVAPGALVGKSVYDLFPQDQANSILADVRRCMDAEKGLTLETSVLLGGRQCWFKTSIQPVRDGAGRTYAAMIHATDITDKHLAKVALEEANDRLEARVIERTAELERVKNRIEAIFDHSGDGILLLDVDNGIQQANYTFGMQSGLPAQNTLGRKLDAFVEPASAGTVNAIVQSAAASHSRQRLETRFWRADGSSFDAEISIAPVNRTQPSVTSLVCIIRDITERKQTERALEQTLHQELQFQAYLKALHDISIQLARTEMLDDFYRVIVEQGLARFDFERLELLLYDPAHDAAVGTYVTDMNGRVVDGRPTRRDPASLTGILKRASERSERFVFDEETMLYVDFQPIGGGSSAAAALWDGELLGWLVIDNALERRPITQPQIDILTLYALTAGSLLARKRAEQRTFSLSQHLDLATRSGGIGTWEWDFQTDRLIWDERMFVLHGLPAQETPLPPGAANRYIHPADLTRVLSLSLAALNEGVPYDTEYRIVRPTGEIRHLKANGITLYDAAGDPLKMVGVNWDITDLKHSEETLRQALRKEKELGELKSRFVSMASHEFRTPLATILAAAETLAAYRSRMSEDQIEARLVKIRQQVIYMKDVMEDVLHLARIQAGRVEFRPAQHNLDDLCREIIEEFDSSVQHQGRLHYTCDAPPVNADVDVRLMRQVIGNLISNALKYSPIEKPVLVRLSDDGEEQVLSVKDEGIGIPTKDLAHLFEPFHRASNVGAISGTGLGMSITRQAMEMHGGVIMVESEEGRGTTFTVILPVKPADTAP